MATFHLSTALSHSSTDVCAYTTVLSLSKPLNLMMSSSSSSKIHSRDLSTLHWSHQIEIELRKHPKWSRNVSFFSSFLTKNTDTESLKQELLDSIAPLDRGASATSEDQQRVDQVALKLEAVNKVKEPLKSSLLNGKWELLYTTSKSILQTDRPKFLRPNGKIYQAINVDTLRAQNMETWPFFNQATANLVPLSASRVAVKFDNFKIAALIPIKSRGSGRGQLEITYLDEELRISRGNQGNLFVLKMVDPTYRVPL